MSSKVANVSKQPYARILIPEEDGGFAAELLEFPGCFAQGATSEEALRNLDAAAAEWADATRKQGIDVPEPSAAHGYSGTVSLRLPKALHRNAVRMAARDGVSLNQFLVSAVAARIGAEDFLNRMVSRAQTIYMASFTNTMLTVNLLPATDASGQTVLLPSIPFGIAGTATTLPTVPAGARERADG